MDMAALSCTVSMMAAGIVVVEEAQKPSSNGNINTTATEPLSPTLSSYIGLSFAIFLGFLPQSSISLVSSLQSRNRELSLKLIQAEEQLRQMKSRRKEDSKANARVVDIFATHRNGWQQQERRLLHQIDASAQEIAHLRAKVEELENFQAHLQREVEEREEIINFMSRRANDQEEDLADDDEDFAMRSVEHLQLNKESEVGAGFCASYGSYSRCMDEEKEVQNGEFDTTNYRDFSRFDYMRVSGGLYPVPEEFLMDGDGNGRETDFLFGSQNGLSTRDLLPSASKISAEKASNWQQDIRCESLEPSYQTKHFVARREFPWNIDGETTGVPAKLKLLEQELMNLEKIDKGELLKIPSMLRKQAKRYQALAGKIDDLCRKMRANDLSEQTLSSKFQTQQQTEFLVEAHRLQQRAIETGRKLFKLQAETAKSNFSTDLESHAKITTRRSLDSIRNNFREIQRNLEVWLARIMGDLEGILLAKDGASRVRDYYMSRYPSVSVNNL